MRTSRRRSSSSTSRGAPSSSTSSPRSSRPLRAGRDGAARSVADERYRAHRAVRRLLELLAGERPLVVVLDDLHWSDEASIELLAALLRREPDAPVLLALAFRPGQAPAGLVCGARGAVGPPDRARAAHRGRRRPSCSASSSRARPRRSTATAAATRSTSSSSGARARTGDCAAAIDGDRPTSAWREYRCPPPSRRRSPRSSRRSRRTSWRCSGRRRSQASRSSPTSRRRSPSFPRRTGLAALDALLALDLVRPTPVPRRFVFRHPLVRRAVYESAPAGWRLAAHARAAAALAARGAAAAERAHHVEQYAGQGDEEAIALLLEAGTRRGAGAGRRRRAGSRRRCACCPRPTSARWTCAWPSRRRSARSASSTAAARRCWRRSSCCPPDAVARRVELTAHCAAVEHWLGRHDEAHRRLTRAWEELPDRSTAEAAVLEIELAVDGLYELDFEQAVEMGRQALGDGAGGRRPRR